MLKGNVNVAHAQVLCYMFKNQGSLTSCGFLSLFKQITGRSLHTTAQIITKC